MDNDMIDEEVQRINVGQSSGVKRGKRDKKNVTGTEIADEFLTNVLIEQITLGRKDGIGFTSEGWREIERKIKEKFGDAYNKAKIRNYLRTVKSHYNHIKILMGLSGFGWDDITKRVTAKDQIWDDYLKDCIGAIDGTYITAWVPIKDHQRYRCRKGFIAQNVMAIVGFDMPLQFVCAGFEGSANDQKVLTDVLQNKGVHNLQIPYGKYYLVDAGYGNRRGFIGPYRGTRYYLKEYGPQALAPRTPSELFNLQHAKLRNVIEKTFSLWKERFPILTHMPRNYPIKTQVKIVNACAVFTQLYHVEKSQYGYII
ncbi:putative nuclease HARBI1 [Cinnamomum micranthum f. kanehirae]|uniref:Putative nuclease HARBI1 n=1 Tax=Cinnamomum micranthum f. kanehirae TaxID=337451 RepID=A0A3S3NTQ3_9MAGN|nr:putative nuclease HARBI1 [Cinnamomum micranthum f. kanehirae]